MSPKTKKPVAGEATGSLEIDVLAGKIDDQEDNKRLHDLQAARLRRRYLISLPVARCLAELAFHPEGATW